MTYSIREKIAGWFAGGCALAALALVGGCQVAQPQKPDLVNADPIVVDPAMAVRQWDQSAAVYPNFSSTTGPAEAMLIPSQSLSDVPHAAMETPMFLANFLCSPIEAIEFPLYSQIETASFYLPPTYTANPPLDPARPDDFSGGPGTGYNPAAGRAVHY